MTFDISTIDGISALQKNSVHSAAEIHDIDLRSIYYKLVVCTNNTEPRSS